MKKILILAILLTLTPVANSSESKVFGIKAIDVVLFRPAGFVVTVLGSVLFTGIFPLTAVAAVSPPHDAFDRMAESLVIPPANFTFNRPLGVMYPDADGIYRK